MLSSMSTLVRRVLLRPERDRHEDAAVAAGPPLKLVVCAVALGMIAGALLAPAAPPEGGGATAAARTPSAAAATP